MCRGKKISGSSPCFTWLVVGELDNPFTLSAGQALKGLLYEEKKL